MHIESPFGDTGFIGDVFNANLREAALRKQSFGNLIQFAFRLSALKLPQIDLFLSHVSALHEVIWDKAYKDNMVNLFTKLGILNLFYHREGADTSGKTLALNANSFSSRITFLSSSGKSRAFI